jgi:hypothetical protein
MTKNQIRALGFTLLISQATFATDRLEESHISSPSAHPSPEPAMLVQQRSGGDPGTDPTTIPALSDSQALYKRVSPSLIDYANFKLRISNNAEPKDGRLSALMVDPLTILAAAEAAVKQSKSIIDILSAPYNLVADLIFNKKNFVGFKKNKELATQINNLCLAYINYHGNHQEMAKEAIVKSFWHDKHNDLAAKVASHVSISGEDLWLQVSKVFVRTRAKPIPQFVLFLEEWADAHKFPGIEDLLIPIFKQMDLLLDDPKYAKERKKRGL